MGELQPSPRLRLASCFARYPSANAVRPLKENGQITRYIIPFAQFKLKWRFTDPAYNVLPDSVLSQILVYGPEKSKKLRQKAMSCFGGPYTLDKSKFTLITELNTSTDALKCKTWLKDCLVDSKAQLSLSWDAETAAQATAEIFCQYWDDFCYPSSDDLVVLPTTGNWMLYYFHEERFLFGRLAA